MPKIARLEISRDQYTTVSFAVDDGVSEQAIMHSQKLARLLGPEEWRYAEFDSVIEIESVEFLEGAEAEQEAKDFNIIDATGEL